MPRKPRAEFSLTTKLAACLMRVNEMLCAIVDPCERETITSLVMGGILAERTTKCKIDACLLVLPCFGLVEIHRKCGKLLGSTGATQFDHIKRNEIEPDNSVENCRPICQECHAIKTARDAAEAAKGRAIRKETKKSRRPKAKIRSRNTLSKEYRDGILKGVRDGRLRSSRQE